jgi:tRNA wybutosine-synthesizing protein 3
MAQFSLIKKDFLQKEDKSGKGSIDIEIFHIICQINELPDFFTTSSCSGRVVMFVPNRNKNCFETVFSSHESLSKVHLNDYEKYPDVSLRFEPLIMHIRCRTLFHATSLLKLCQKEGGLKKTALISLGNKIIIEIRSTDYLEMPIKKSDQCVVSDFGIIKKEVEKKFDKNKKRIERLNTAIKCLSQQFN